MRHTLHVSGHLYCTLLHAKIAETKVITYTVSRETAASEMLAQQFVPFLQRPTVHVCSAFIFKQSYHRLSVELKLTSFCPLPDITLCGVL